MNEEQLSARQGEALEAIRRLTREKGYPPTVRELGAELGLKSTSSTAKLLSYLRKSGAVTWVTGQVRTLQVIE